MLQGISRVKGKRNNELDWVAKRLSPRDVRMPPSRENKFSAGIKPNAGLPC